MLCFSFSFFFWCILVEAGRGKIGEERTAIHLLAGARSIAAICETDESEALGSLGLSVSGKEDSGDAAEAFEQIAEFSFFRQLGNLLFVVRIDMIYI